MGWFTRSPALGRSRLALGIFGKKKSSSATDPNPETPAPSRLQEITGTDSEMYQLLSRLLFLDPKKIMTSLEDAVSEASTFEKSGNRIRAEVWYRIAGGISLYRGDGDAVRTFFEKAASIAGTARPEFKIAAARSEEAVSLAKKYYESL